MDTKRPTQGVSYDSSRGVTAQRNSITTTDSFEQIDSGLGGMNFEEKEVSHNTDEFSSIVEETNTSLSDARETVVCPVEEQTDSDSGFNSGLFRSSIPNEIKAFIPNSEGDHILHIASAQGKHDMLTYVFQFVDLYPILMSCLNDQNDLGQTPLHIAVHTNQPAIVKELLIRGAQVDLMDLKGNTPVHVACLKGFDKVLGAMLAVTANHVLKQAAEIRNREGKACPHLAVLRDDKTVLSWLQRVGVDLNMQESGSGKTALHMAIEKGSLALVQCLIDDCQVEVNIPTYSGYTPLHVAAGQGSLDLTCYLVAVGADPSALTDEEDLPLDITPDYDVEVFLRRITNMRDQNGVVF